VPQAPVSPPAVTPAVASEPLAQPAAAPPVEVVTRPSDPGLDLLGSPAVATMATRTIVIKPDTRYVNVTGGEIIRFDVDGKSFVWNFNGQRNSFDLARVAPPSMLTRKVTAYVAPNPMYPRRN
jgi:Heavy-metal resistance protein CzcE